MWINWENQKDQRETKQSQDNHAYCARDVIQSDDTIQNAKEKLPAKVPAQVSIAVEHYPY